MAIAEVHALARQLHKASAGEQPVLKARILAAGKLLGILQQDPQEWLQGGAAADAISAAAIEALIEERQEAKRAKNYARADAGPPGVAGAGCGAGGFPGGNPVAQGLAQALLAGFNTLHDQGVDRHGADPTRHRRVGAGLVQQG